MAGKTATKRLLSTNLLELKFMKKSKEDRERVKEQDEYSKIFETSQLADDSGVRITHQTDISVVEKLAFPRRSYGGSNAEIEKLMHEQDLLLLGDDYSLDVRLVKEEVDVTDEQLSDLLSGPSRSIFKKFKKGGVKGNVSEKNFSRDTSSSRTLYSSNKKNRI